MTKRQINLMLETRHVFKGETKEEKANKKQTKNSRGRKRKEKIL